MFPAILTETNPESPRQFVVCDTPWIFYEQLSNEVFRFVANLGEIFFIKLVVNLNDICERFLVVFAEKRGGTT